ncbi:MAG: hypothetical protein M3Z05_09410 [Gemmatimonadota bacterium]|nr:hypothetical protein [Gemmatimonadota bacterium]
MTDEQRSIPSASVSYAQSGKSPKEWFLVPLPVIDEAVRAIRDGSITKKVYDPTTARLVEM